MKKKQSYIILVFLALIILLSVMPMSFSSAASEPKYETGGQEFMDETSAGMALYNQEKSSLPSLPGGGIPPQSKVVSGTKLYINYRLWKDQGVLCYGSYLKVPKNDFKNCTQKPGHPVVENAGYYSKGGKRGEYRYHGYDVNGNKLTNLNFKPDAVVTKFNERAWIKNPWSELPENKRPQQRSIYNEAATGIKIYPDPTVMPSVQNWINKSLQQYGGVPLLGSVVDPEIFRYLYVESAPTIQGIGQGRMWHRSVYDNSIWYQTIAVPQLKAKSNLPVVANIELLTELPENIQDVGAAMDDKKIILRFKVTGILQDEDVYDDPVKMTVYYTRYDVKDWNITFTGPEKPAQNNAKAANTVNTGSNEFEYETTYGFLRSHSSESGGKITWNLHFTATARPNYKDGKQGLTGNAAYDLGIGIVPVPEPEIQFVKGFDIAHDIPEIAFEGVPFTAEDNSDMSRVEYRKVSIDGEEVNGDDFFSGSFTFPGEVGENGRFAYVDCEYKIKDYPMGSGIATSRDVIYIYPTKPIANYHISSNTWKQNHIIRAEDTSDEGNIQLILNEYPIVDYEWTFGDDTSQIRMGTDTDKEKEFIIKKPGSYSLTLRVKNTLGRWSDPFTVDFQVLEDVAPALGVNLSGSVYTRNDKVDAWYYFVGSTDGDVIKSSSLELWYDSNNDGTLDQRLNTWNNPEAFPAYTPTKLGYYKYILKAKEDIISDTLPQYITEADKKSASYEVEFWVDNFRPLSDIYVNIPIQRPEIDVYFMLDKNLDAGKKDYILNNRVNMANWLLGKNIIPNVFIWDMRTYTYSQPASTSRSTGGSYPPKTVYYESNGYSGTLSRYDVSNDPYSRDKGHYKDKEESKTATKTGSGWAKIYWKCGQYGGWYIDDSDESNNDTVDYSDSDGYKGKLHKTSYKLVDDTGEPSGGKPGDKYTQRKTFKATYKGTVTRTVEVWVPDIVWYDDYTGYYSGTIYKDVRQPYVDQFNPTAQKYVVYISDSTISELNDLNMVMGYASTAKLFLAGTDGMKAQRSYDSFFSTIGKTIDKTADEVLQAIAENSTAVERYYVLQNQAFTMNVGQFDLEGDPIVETGMQYVHEPGYFDNPTGIEPGSVSAYSDAVGWTSEIKNSFANTGKYTIYRRVKDRPSTDPNFAGYSYYSGSTYIEIYTVRKPVALATLDWDFDPAAGVYMTTWVDHSYDPDHQYNRPDKGIVDRNIMWRRNGGQWNYGIPDRLTPGSYEVNYYVLDPEGYWSDPWVYNFTLSNEPPVQFNASLRTLDNQFSLQSVPASEYLEAFNLLTRYPYDVKLEMALYNGASRVTPLKSVVFDRFAGTKTGNDIAWNNIIYQIPETLPDRAYEFRISAVGDNGKTAVKSFTVNVSTPINLQPAMPGEAMGGTSVQVSAGTTKYAGAVRVTLFSGTAYERSQSLSVTSAGGAGKSWEGNFSIPDNIPEGNYTARFTAVAPNGAGQTKDVPFRLINLGIKNVSIAGYWNHWRGQVDLLGERLSNEPHRFLSLECVKINVETLGNPERVTVRFSPELEAMSYTDPNGHIYHYGSDYFGYEVEFPADSTFTPEGNSVYWEYHLPLAPSTRGWDNGRLRQPYKMTVTAFKAGKTVEHVIDDIEITGNIYDLTYIQPKSR